MKRYNLLKLVFVITFLQCSTVNALNIIPMKIDLDVRAGEKYSGSISIINDSSIIESSIIYFEDWDKSSDGKDIFLKSENSSRSCADWFSLSPTQLLIESESLKEVNYLIEVPEIASGTYWTFIMIEGTSRPVKPSESNDSMKVKINATFRYAVRVIINVESKIDKESEITDIEFLYSDVNSENAMKAQIVIKNTGDTLVNPVGFLEIRDFDGNSVERYELPKNLYVMPYRLRNIEMTIPNNLDKGDYLAIAIIDYGGDGLIAGEARFSIPFKLDNRIE